MAQTERPSAEKIREQLGMMLKRRPFCNSPRLSAFLRFVVEETLSRPETSLKQYTLGVTVFGRGSDFDPDADPIVRVQAGRVRRALRRYYDEAGANDPIRVGIPLGGYVPSFAFRECTEAADLDLDPLSVAVPRGMPTVAVLRMIDRSPTPLSPHLIDGFSEEVVGELSRFPLVRVLGYSTSSRLLSPNPVDWPQHPCVAADYTLSAAVREESNGTTLSLHLLRSADQVEVWAKRFHKAGADGRATLVDFDLVSRVANEVGGAFGAVHTLRHRKGVEKARKDIDAYEAIMAFHRFELSLNPLEFDETLRFLETAHESDAHNPLLMAMLGMLLLDSHVYGFAEIPDAITRATGLIQRARSFDPCSQWVHHTSAYLAALDGDRARVLRDAETIVDLNPNNAHMMGVASFWFSVAGDYARGAVLFARSRSLNPFHATYLHFGPFLRAFHERAYEEALLHAQKFALPDFYWSQVLTAAALSRLDDVRGARAAYERIEQHRPGFSSNIRRELATFILDPDLREDLLLALRESRTGVASASAMVQVGSAS